MKSKFLLLSIFVSFALIVSIVYAGVLTVSVSLPTKSLTENEQVTATVTVTNPSGTESSIVTELSSSPNWFSVVQACSTINSLSASQSGTSTCIIKPTSTGSDLTLTARSEPQSGAGNSGTGSTSGINVASQSSSLTASISASSSVGTSTTFYVGATVAAPSANDVKDARATISRSGQCEIDTTDVPAQQNLGNITKGTTKSVTNWKLTSSSASGTCTVTVNVVSDVGGSASPSKAITVGTPSTDSGSSSSSSGGGGGGGAGTAAKAKVLVGDKEAIVTIPSIAAKAEVNFSIVSQALVITEMKVKVVNTVSNIQITATKLDARPGTLVSDAPGVVNQYLSIDKVNISEADIEKVTMDFKVEKTWIASNNIDESTVSLYRYVNDVWNKLETVKVNEDSTNIYYQSTSPGLSVFAVAGESKSISQPAPEQKPEEKKTVGEEFIEGLKKDTWKIVVIVVGVVIAVVAVVYFVRMKSSLVKKKRTKQY